MVVSIITSSFLVYIFFYCPEAVSCWQLQKLFLSVNRSLPCFVQREIRWKLWKLIEGLMLEYWSYVSWSGRLMLGHLSQHCNTQFQCGNAWSDREYAHIVAFAMSYALALIWCPCGMTVFLYVPYMRIYFPPDLLFWTFWIWSLMFLKCQSRHDSN